MRRFDIAGHLELNSGHLLYDPEFDTSFINNKLIALASACTRTCGRLSSETVSNDS